MGSLSQSRRVIANRWHPEEEHQRPTACALLGCRVAPTLGHRSNTTPPTPYRAPGHPWPAQRRSSSTRCHGYPESPAIWIAEAAKPLRSTSRCPGARRSTNHGGDRSRGWHTSFRAASHHPPRTSPHPSCSQRSLKNLGQRQRPGSPGNPVIVDVHPSRPLPRARLQLPRDDRSDWRNRRFARTQLGASTKR